MSAWMAYAADDHAFNQLVWISFQKQPILEGTWFHLIGIGNQVFGMRCILTHGDEAPLHARRKSSTAAASQLGLRNQLGDRGRRHAQSLAQAFVAARLLIGFEVQRLVSVGRDVLGKRRSPFAGSLVVREYFVNVVRFDVAI